MPKRQLVDETERNKWILGLGSGHYNGLDVCSDFHSSCTGEILSVLQFWVKFKEKIKVPEAESFEVLLLRQSECNRYNFQ